MPAVPAVPAVPEVTAVTGGGDDAQQITITDLFSNQTITISALAVATVLAALLLRELSYNFICFCLSSQDAPEVM